ncbi:hypothetical protein T02_16158 [Trichinella nativa]|uniref:Uncharacterized protein n=1 Tax=Trichinella nativa TaxID=6335 RepID=A0A0V1KQI3_9BILA|nr:hypothetical protein T06_13485 [Trichinella sp. T6]KRZ49530.1 hypothetical protein T02_16158 [Trichinella nativa]
MNWFFFWHPGFCYLFICISIATIPYNEEVVEGPEIAAIQNWQESPVVKETFIFKVSRINCITSDGVHKISENPSCWMLILVRKRRFRAGS